MYTWRILRGGVGDHSVVVPSGSKWLYLFFHEWDETAGHPTGVGLARSAVESGGVPGSWKKYLCTAGGGCGFNSDGIGGASSMVSNISGSGVTWRPLAGSRHGEFVAIGTRTHGIMRESGSGSQDDPALYGKGARLAFHRPTAEGEPPVVFEQAAEPLIFADSESWARSNASRELYAYDSIVVDPIDSTTLWFYYTYLLPAGARMFSVTFCKIVHNVKYICVHIIVQLTGRRYGCGRGVPRAILPAPARRY